MSVEGSDLWPEHERSIAPSRPVHYLDVREVKAPSRLKENLRSARTKGAVAFQGKVEVNRMGHASGRATSLMSPGPGHTRSSSFTSLRRSATALLSARLGAKQTS